MLFQDEVTAKAYKMNKYGACNLVYLSNADWSNLETFMDATTYPSTVTLPGFKPITQPEYAAWINLASKTSAGYFDTSQTHMRDWPGLDSRLRSAFLSHLVDGTFASLLRSDQARLRDVKKKGKKAAQTAAAAGGASTSAAAGASASAAAAAADETGDETAEMDTERPVSHTLNSPVGEPMLSIGSLIPDPP